MGISCSVSLCQSLILSKLSGVLSLVGTLRYVPSGVLSILGTLGYGPSVTSAAVCFMNISANVSNALNI